jgi:hypothetical protein
VISKQYALISNQQSVIASPGYPGGGATNLKRRQSGLEYSNKNQERRKGINMKRYKTLLFIGVFLVLAVGCSTTKSTENLLSAAGFKMMPADTPEKVAHLNSLPSGKITRVQRNGMLYFTYPDAKNRMLYVGHQEQYQEYQRLRLQQQLTEEQLSAA